MYFSIAVEALMVLFAIAGAFDFLFLKNKYGLGQKFKEGIELIGPLCFAIVGIIAFVPLIAWCIENTISPLYEKMGLDPSMAVTSIIAIDMGGYQLSMAVTKDTLIGNWAGIVYGSMMGATIVYTIPVGLQAIKAKDRDYFAKGVLYGIAAIPFGTFVGGLMMGINVITVLLNLIPAVIFSVIVIVCLAIWPNGTTNAFRFFGKFVTAFGIVAMLVAMIKQFVLVPIADTGAFDITAVPFWNLVGSCTEGVEVAGLIGLILSGAMPFAFCLNKWLAKPISSISKKTDVTQAGASGFFVQLADNMPMFSDYHLMSNREKIVIMSFSVCGSFLIGGHLAFAAAFAPQYIGAMMVAKIVSGVIAMGISLLFTRKMKTSANAKPVDESLKHQ